MNSIYQDLKEKHILITENSNGIGEALTKILAQKTV